MKLKINTVAGILDIIASVIYASVFFILFAIAFGTDGQAANTVANAIILFALVCAGVHAWGLSQSKENDMKISGHVLGIIGHMVYIFGGILLSLPAMILTVLAAIFTLVNNKPINQQPTEEIERSEKKMKLKINTIAGVLDIIASVIYASILFMAFFVPPTSNGDIDIGHLLLGVIMLLFPIICTGIHIYGLVKSKQNNMKISGHVLGIIGHLLCLLTGYLLFIPAMVLSILAAVFTLKNNKPDNQQPIQQI